MRELATTSYLQVHVKDKNEVDKAVSQPQRVGTPIGSIGRFDEGDLHRRDERCEEESGSRREVPVCVSREGEGCADVART